ncbi:MAG: sigma-54-dependent Fis family transcriptional regulator [Gammaproteobacteria bacterium]|nr:sigma-54-dependent Fis family transcriptional regulator [Gammaproteobacteria bacterium]
MSLQSLNTLPVLLVDDEASVLLSSKMLLHSVGVRNVETLEDSRELMPYLARHRVAAIVLDLFMPYVTGNQLLPEIVQQYPEIPVIVMTASQEVETAVACMKEGAFDYLVKPVEESRYTSCVKRVLEVRALRQQLGAMKRSLLSDRLDHPDVFSSIMTANRKMRSLFQYMEAIAFSNEPILIIGETGVGKGLLAEAAHRLSACPGKLVQLNVAGADDALFSDTLFGHRKGAFTGADQAREGLVAQAAAGTLFLDEIGDLTITSQVKLLRLLQEQSYYPLGSDVPKNSDIRILCATHQDLRAQMSQGQFRSDLYFRLSVHQIEVPPLRERKEDIPLLLGHFIEQAAHSMKKPAPTPPSELLTLLANHHFPGNVRELRAMVYDAVAQHRSGPVLSMESFRGVIQKQRIPARLAKKEHGTETHPLIVPEGAPFPTLKEAETELVTEALRRAKGNQGIAAALLGISRPALNRRLSRLKTDSAD